MRKVLSSYFLEIIFILLLALIPLLWYKPGYMGLGHDMGYPLTPTDFFQDRLFTWTDRSSTFGANQNDDLAGFFIHGLEVVVVLPGIPLIFSQKLVFIFWFVLPGLTMYIFLRSLYPEKEKFVLRLSGSLFYVFNHYLLQAWFMAEMTKLSIISAIPLVSLLIINAMYKRKPVFRSSILLAVTLFFLNGGPGIPLWGGLIVISLILLFFLFIFSTEKFFLKLKRLVSFILLSTVLLALLNSYWIYPYLKSYGQNYTQSIDAAGGLINVVNWSQIISNNTSFSNLFKLQGITEWYDNPGHPYANVFLGNPLLIFLSIFFPILGFIGILKKKGEIRDESVYKVVLLTILLVGIILSAGSHPPFGKFYDFALQNIPLFPMFRSPIYKFGMVLWFAYSFFIGLGLYSLARLIVSYFSIKVSFEKVGIVLLVIFSSLLAIYNYPFFTGSFFNWSDKYSTMVKVPDYIFDAKKEMDKDKFSTRTLLLPKLDPLNHVLSYNWGYYSIEPLFYLLDRISTVVSQPRLKDFEKSLMEATYTQLDREGKSNLLRFIGADRAIIQNDFNFVQNLNYSYSNIKSRVSNTDDFVFDQKIGEWDLYSLGGNNVMPRIYAPSQITYISSSMQGLPLVSEIPFSPILGEAFYFSGLLTSEEPKIPEEFFTQYITEGRCTNCEREAKITLETTPLLIPPGNRFYPTMKFIQQLKRNEITDLEKRNKFILEAMGKKVGSLADFYYYDVDYSISVADDLISDLKEIRSNQFAIKDMAKKENDKAQIYQFLKHYVSLVSHWKTSSSVEEITQKLAELEKTMIDLTEELGLTQGDRPGDRDNFLYEYSLVIPQKGFYRISLYTPAKDRHEYSIILNSETLNLTRSDSENPWLQSSPLMLDKANLQISIPQIEALSGEVTTFPDAQVELKRDDEKCQFFNSFQKELHQGTDYRIEFKEKVILGQAPQLQIIESNKELNLPDEQRSFDYKIEVINSDPTHIKNTIIFKPAQFTKDISFKFCFSSVETPSATKITDFQMTPVYPTPLIFASSFEGIDEDKKAPDIEFVSLNQTKYLIRLKNIPKNFILNFNSRFDNQWKIREFNSPRVGEYFEGSKKAYMGGKVTEYNRLDKHVILDLNSLLWEDQGVSPNITLNGFANGWLINGEDEVEEKVYLLEYTYQNSFYKGVLVSVITLSILGLMYIKHRI